MTVENIYHAVVKKNEGDVPRRVVYTAPDVATAMSTMATLCGAHSTASIYEFEILQVIGRDQYKQVAMKPASKTKPHVKVEVPPVLDTSKIDSDRTEKIYTPYHLEVA